VGIAYDVEPLWDAHGTSTFNVARGTLNGDFTITAESVSGFDDDGDIRAGLWERQRAL